MIQPYYTGHDSLHTVHYIFTSICYLGTCQTKHQCAYTRNTVTYISCHTGHCYLMYMYHRYTYYDTPHYYFVFISHRYIAAPLHGIPSFYILLSSYMDSRHITVTHACMVSIFLSYGSPFILHVILMYSCYMIVSRSVIDIPVTGYMSR